MRKFQLKGWENLDTTSTLPENGEHDIETILTQRTLAEPFNVSGLRERLIRWIVTDDQVRPTIVLSCMTAQILSSLSV